MMIDHQRPDLDGPGLFAVDLPTGETHITNVRRLAGNARKPGSVLIATGAGLLALLGAGLLYVSFEAQYLYIFHAKHQHVPSMIEAGMLDVGMLIFATLGLGLSRAGKSSRVERALIMICAGLSALMNFGAADTASPRSVAAFVAAPLFLAIVTDRCIAVVRRHVLGMDEPSAWSTMGVAVKAVARVALVLTLYSLRTALAPSETLSGLRRLVLNAAPLPGIVPVIEADDEHQDDDELPPTKKAAFLALYRAHGDYGNRALASQVAKELAPKAELAWGTARTYVGAELARIEAQS
jgi:hypothetical protein